MVAKFGGTSVSSAASWRAIARLIERHRAEGYRPLVVCSALAGVTNGLERILAAAGRGVYDAEAIELLDERHAKLAGDLGIDADAVLGETRARLTGRVRELANTAHVPPWAHAEVMAHGELMSTRLGAAWLTHSGIEARWHDARQMLRARPAPSGSSSVQRYLSASCDVRPDPALQRLLSGQGPALVTQGFIASDERGDTVLLGRGGSDTSAAYLAAKLSAQRLEIWTDVPGVFTANPAAVSDARLVTKLTYAEAQVLAGLGARVLHPRCVEALNGGHIPLCLGATHRGRGGTTINGHAARTGIKAIVSRTKLLLLSMRRSPAWQPVGFMADVAGCFAENGISMDLLSSSPGEIRATIDTTAFPDAVARKDVLLRSLSRVCDAEATLDVASVSLVGHRLSEDRLRYSKAGRLFQGQPALLITHSADDSSLTHVVRHEAADGLVRALHAELFEQDAAAAAAELGPTWRELTRAPSAASSATRVVA